MKVLAIIILVIFILLTLVLILFGVTCKVGNNEGKEIKILWLANLINAIICFPVQVFMILYLCGI